MKISNELILEVADIDHISVVCASCGGRVDLSLNALNDIQPDKKKKQELPAQCPTCSDSWSEIRNAVGQFKQTLTGLEKFDISFRLQAPPAVVDKKS